MLSTLKLYFQSVPESAVEIKTVKIQSWYCKPAILESLGDYYQKRSNGFLKFISCEKYGCRQFLPKFHFTFPVGYVFEIPSPADGIVEIAPMFNDHALPFIKK